MSHDSLKKSAYARIYIYIYLEVRGSGDEWLLGWQKKGNGRDLLEKNLEKEQ